MTDRALADALTRHQIYLQRYASGRVNAALPFIRRLARELRARVAEDDLTAFEAMRLTALQRDLERIAAGTLAAVEQQLTLDLEGLAEYEAQWANRILAGAVVVDTAAVAPELVRAAITTVPMKLLSGDEVREVTIQQAFREFAGSIAQDVRQTVQAGIVTGETTPNIARQVSSLVDNRTRRQAETLVRTATNHAGNTARMEVWKRNADIITHEKFAATLDGRTTLQCSGNDGKVSPLGTGPRPPLHWACRSVLIPQVRPDLRIPGLDSKRSSIDGPVDASLTYDGFLRRQDEAFQNDVLGLERAKLFRAGMPVSRFTDASGRTYTLAELRAIDKG